MTCCLFDFWRTSLATVFFFFQSGNCPVEGLRLAILRHVHLAGFLCLVSSEVSALVICVITLDHFLVLLFPFSRIRLQSSSAHLACCLLWIGGALLAGVSLLPVTQHWQLYSQTAVCIPLPVTRQTYAGHRYSIGVIIVLSFVPFVLITAGQGPCACQSV